MDGDFALLMGHKIYAKKLEDYLAYRLKGICSAKQINTALQSKNPLAELEKYKQSDKNEKFVSSRVEARVRDIEKFNITGVTKYLDIGCGDGTITAGIGKYFNLSKDSIVGCDITQWAGHEHENEVSDDITFIPMESSDKLPTDETFELITIFMALHHMNNDVLQSLIKECSRVLSPNGVILVREHDCPNAMISALINIEHAMFEVVIEGKTPANEFASSYYGKYYTRRQWNNIFADLGFYTFGDPISNLKNNTRPFYQLYKSNNKKIDDISISELRRQAVVRNIPIQHYSNTKEIKSRLIFRN